MISTEILPISDIYGNLAYGTKNGLFFVYEPSSARIHSIYQCRDSFGYRWKRARYVGFKTLRIDTKSVGAFFTKIETKLGVAPDDQTVIHMTDMAGALILHVSPFWMVNETRRSVFTLMLRMAAVYYKGDINKAIKAYPLARSVGAAVRWFLDGAIKPTYKRLTARDIGGARGFVAEVSGLRTKAQLATKLVRP